MVIGRRLTCDREKLNDVSVANQFFCWV